MSKSDLGRKGLMFSLQLTFYHEEKLWWVLKKKPQKGAQLLALHGSLEKLFIQPRTTCPSMALPTVGWTLTYQS